MSSLSKGHGKVLGFSNFSVCAANIRASTYYRFKVSI